MSKRKVTLTIICEDTQHECFARRFLSGMGWDKRGLRIVKSPSGRGSGEQWVRQKYAEELKSFRKRHVEYAFISILDGDAHGVLGRIQQFDNSCGELGIPHRQPDDKAAIIVPTRSIETWISYLMGKQIEEDSTYPKLRCESECYPAVEKLLSLCKTTGLPENAPSSLKAACVEFKTRIYK